MRSHNWLTIFVVFIVTGFLSWGRPALPALAAHSSFTVSQTICDIDFNRNQKSYSQANLEITMTPGCLEEIFNASQLLNDVENRIEDETNNRLQISNLQYRLKDTDVIVTSHAVFKAPFSGALELDVVQNLIVGAKNGKLTLEVGDTNVTSSRNIPENLVATFIKRQVENQIQRWNGKPINELFLENGGKQMASQMGINKDDLALIFELLEENVALEVSRGDIAIDIRLPENQTLPSEKLPENVEKL